MIMQIAPPLPTLLDHFIRISHSRGEYSISMSKDKEGKKSVEDQEWYHGYRPRKDCKSLLKTPGEFLVRATDTGTGASTDIVITALDDNCKIVNLTLRLDEGQWYIGTKRDGKLKKFKTITELIEYFRVHPPSRKLKMSKVVARPVWMIKHAQVNYEKTALGSGNFCSVYKGTLSRCKEESMTVAVKISHSTNSGPEGESDEAKEARKAMVHEAQIMSYYTHDNVIKFLGVACDVKPVLVVMEFCPGGDLVTHLQKRGKEIGIPEKVLYSYEASLGMTYLHSKNCVHRDLAARNCLISANGVVKISDFGLSKMRDENQEKSEKETENNAQVPLRWMAPESLTKPYPFSLKTDVWAYAVMLYEIFNDGVKPFPDDPLKVVAKKIKRLEMPKMPEKTPLGIQTITKKIWVFEASKRPSMREITGKLYEMCKNDPVASPEVLAVNKITGVKRSVVTLADDTESDDSGTTDNDTLKKGLVKKPRSTRAKQRRAGSNRE